MVWVSVVVFVVAGAYLTWLMDVSSSEAAVNKFI